MIGNGGRAACQARTTQGGGGFPTCFSKSTEPGFSSLWCVSRSTLCTVPSISPVKAIRSPSRGQGHCKGLSPLLESGLLISRLQWKSLRRNTQDPPLLLTRGVLKYHTGVHCAPSQGLDHHGHVWDLIPGELLEGCLLTGEALTELAMPQSNYSPWQPRALTVFLLAEEGSWRGTLCSLSRPKLEDPFFSLRFLSFCGQLHHGRPQARSY